MVKILCQQNHVLGSSLLIELCPFAATQALSATIASGIRSIFAYSHAPYFTKWDSKTCELSHDILPDSTMAHLFELARGQPYGNGRVHIGFGFDYWFLPKDAVVDIFSGLRSAGIKLFTSHYAKNPTFGKLKRSWLAGDAHF